MRMVDTVRIWLGVASVLLSTWAGQAQVCQPSGNNLFFDGFGKEPFPRQASVRHPDPEGVAEWVLNFRVLLKDDGAPPEGVGPVPLDEIEERRYCEAVNEWSRLTYQATEGTHRIGRVVFYWDQSMAFQEASDAEIEWNRWWVPNGRFRKEALTWKVTGAGTNDATIVGFDEAIGCTPTAALNTSGNPFVMFGCFDEPGALPRTCERIEVNGIDARYCVDPSVGEPIIRTPVNVGLILVHENSHFFYGQDDEYVPIGGSSDGVCLGELSGNPQPESSMMAEFGRTLWCDEGNHLQSRLLGGPEVEPVEICNENAAESAWQVARANWAELGSVHETGVYPEVNLEELPEVECVFEFSPQNDYLVLLDRSGSMATFVNSTTELNALDNARQAAVGLYNAVPEDAESTGIFTYNDEVQKPLPYQPRSSVVESDGPELGSIEAEGTTDICKAIREAADEINDQSPGSGLGAVILLSDGLPTVPGCSSASEVLDAANYACDRPVPVRAHTLAFGDADVELLQQVAQVCNGHSFSVGAAASNLLDRPESFKFELARTGQLARGFHEVLEERPLLRLGQELPLLVPPGSEELFVAWVGDGFERFLNVGDGISECSFRRLRFELESPGGDVFSPAVEGTTKYDAERTAQFVTVQVGDPEPGEWTMRLENADYACRTDEGEAQDPLTGYRPTVQWLAGMRHVNAQARVEASPSLAPRDQPVRITASLSLPEPGLTSPLTVTARLRKDGSSVPFELRDDGESGDEVADDGIYTGIFNSGGAIRTEGMYHVEVDLATIPGTTRVIPGATELLEAALDEGDDREEILDIPASLTARTSFVLLECCEADDTPLCDTCRGGACAVPEFPRLEPGRSYSQLSIATMRFPTGTEGVQVSLGRGIQISDVRADFDPETQAGRVVFAATVARDAPRGRRSVAVQYGHRICRSDEGAFRVFGTDCNRNGIEDDQDLATGSSADINSNGLPDECEIGSVVCRVLGTAQGGTVSTTIVGFFATCTVDLQTIPGDSPEVVAANLAAALNGDACLSGQGITATAMGDLVTVEGFTIDHRGFDKTTTDPGLRFEMPVVSIPTLSGWGLGLFILILLLVGLLRFRTRRLGSA